MHIRIFFSIIFILNFFSNFSQTQNSIIDFNGFFNFKYDLSSDKIYLKIDELEKDFLYVSSLATGLGSNDIGLDRGQLGRERIVHFKRYGNKLLLIEPNQFYRANTKNEAERKSVEEAFAKSVIFGFEIINNKEGIYTIDFTPFLMQDTHGVSKRLKNLNQGSYKLDLLKSAINIERTKAFPKNVEFESILTFVGEAEGDLIVSVSPDPSIFSVNQHNSFIELPDNNFKPRVFDPRSGGIMLSFMDYASPVQDPILKKFVIRHRLEKKTPDLKLSEALKPIIYYLDSGTPEPVRSALLDGARWWNEAFEEIGFKNAFQVKMLPENADPMDCRFNVIQWVHRSTRGWSYGASVVDPRTGEIIKGHVSLGSLRIRQDFLIAQALINKSYENENNYKPMLEMALSRIRQLSAHEVGHTLGFAHNFASSVNNRNSVMDYPHPLIKLKNNKIDLSNAYSIGIGDWDKVTVAYSYSVFNKNNETLELNNIIQSANEKGLQFITDSDARSPSGSHVNAHLWDNGTSVSEGLNDILKIRNIAIDNFSEYNIKKGDPYTMLEDLFVPLYFMHRYQTEAVVKLIGGMDYNYTVRGDNQIIVKDLDFEVQEEALNSLLKSLNAKVLAIPKRLLKLFPPRAYGYSRTRESFKSMTGVSFDPFSAASTASEFTISLLLNPERLNRIIIQNSVDNTKLSLNYLFNSLISNTLETKHNETYLDDIQHVINTNVLINILNLSQSEDLFFKARMELDITIKSLIKKLKKFKNLNSNHHQYLKIIEDFYKNPNDYKNQISPKIPDGSPIGDHSCNYNR
ncbi:MAG: zinc-dependent metalloprotease [Flavobacteriaceae bacterium]